MAGASTLSDEQIAKLTLPELIEIIRRLLEEIEIRTMQVAGES